MTTIVPNKTVWFFERQQSTMRRIWAAVYSAKRVRRAQWERVLTRALETLATVEPFIEDERTSSHLRNQLEKIQREVETWPRD